jgi:GntR family transcriptional repressor for pyruvate dehydrogenase complex
MSTQAQQLAERLARALALGEPSPGSRLPAERMLAATHGVSRATVRDAVSALVERGLLERRRGDGTYVIAPAERHMAEVWRDMAQRHPALQGDLVEFRAMLETQAAGLAASRHDAADRERLVAAHARVDAAYAASDRAEQIRSDVDFHRAIAEATHNPVFAYLTSSLLSLLHDHVKLSLAGVAAATPIALALREQHDALLDAILARDRARARAVAAGHIDFVAVRLNALPRGGHA